MHNESFIEKLQQGDRKAYQVLIEEHKEMVFKTCLRYLREPEDARDIAQDVFVEALNAVADFRKEAAISTWLYRIAVNKSLNFLKKHKRRTLSDDMSGHIPENMHEQDASAKSENEEQKRILSEAISTLSENQRIAFTLHKIEGKSYKEIAQQTGQSLSSVESLIHRAKQNLQKKLLSYYKTHFS